MFELIDFFNVLAYICRLRALPLVKFKLGLAFFEGFGQLIMDFFHFSDMNLFVHQSLL
jgi:hypothetical protein